MKLSIILTTLPLLVSAIPGFHHPKKCCLCKADVDKILNTYGVVFKSTDPKAITNAVNAVIADDFKQYDESNNGGASETASNSKKEFLDLTLGSLKLKPPITDIEIKEIYRFNDCDNIALRFEASGKTSGFLEPIPGVVLPMNTTKVPVGTRVSFKGDTIYKIDCHSKKIKAIYQSQDNNNFLDRIGFNPCAFGFGG